MRLWDTIKALSIPAVIAALLYGLIVHLALPLYRQHRERYSQYLPLRTISTSTSNFSHSLRDRSLPLFTDYVIPLFSARAREQRRQEREYQRQQQAESGDQDDGDGTGDDAVDNGLTPARPSSRPSRSPAASPRPRADTFDEPVLFTDDVGDRLTGFGDVRRMR